MGADNIFGVHGAALQLRSQRLTLLASNIANAATPNYKARDFDFAEALKMATGDGDTENAIGSTMGYRIPSESSLDGNTVELAAEQTIFAENAVRYRTTLSFIEGRIGTLMQAIKGE